MVKLSELKGRVSHANRAATSPQLSVPRTLAHAFTDAQLQHAKQLFAFYDADNNGTVDRNELAQALSKLGAPVSEERLTLLMAEGNKRGWIRVMIVVLRIRRHSPVFHTLLRCDF
jgi:hypothetical protein